MVAIRYFDRLGDVERRTVNGSGVLSGPPGGDGWSVISTLPASRLAAGSHAYAFFVKGTISNLVPFGTVPPAPAGVLQLCLADSAGVRSTVHLVQLPANLSVGHDEGIPFSFLVLFQVNNDGAYTDPTWGAAWPGVADLRLEGRLYWNGDSPTYGIAWDVSDIEWVWADIAAIPSGDRYLQGHIGPNTLSVGGSLNKVAPVDVMAADELWLNFAVVYHGGGLPTSGGVRSVPAFNFGSNGMVIGVDAIPIESIGLALDVTSPAPVPRTTGAFWTAVGRGGPGQDQVGLIRASMTQLGGTAVVVNRVLILSVKLDNLIGVTYRFDRLVAGITEYTTAANPFDLWVPLEVSPLLASWEPFVFVGVCVEQRSTARRSHQLRLDDDTGELYVEQRAFETEQSPSVSANASGRSQLFAAASHGIGYGDPGFQYRLHVLKPGLGGVHDDVAFVHLLAFHPVRDPDGIPEGIPTVGDPIAIVPGAEGPPAAMLATPPIPPNAGHSETQLQRRQSLLGQSGYKRTWGVFLAARRMFSLTWAPVSRADADALFAFLAAGRLWQFQPAREAAAIAVATVAAPRVQQLSGQTYAVACEVVELVYTV